MRSEAASCAAGSEKTIGNLYAMDDSPNKAAPMLMPMAVAVRSGCFWDQRRAVSDDIGAHRCHCAFSSAIDHLRRDMTFNASNLSGRVRSGAAYLGTVQPSGQNAYISTCAALKQSYQPFHPGAMMSQSNGAACGLDAKAEGRRRWR